MELPYYSILIAYFIAITVFLLLAFFNLYHVVKFGLFNRTAKIVTGLFVLISIGILTLSWLFLAGVSWTATFSIFDSFDFGGNGNEEKTLYE